MDTFTSMEIKGFYYRIFQAKIDVFNEADSIPVIVWDNSSIHKSAEIKDFIADSGVSILTIAPYSPCLNPAEHLIGAIKSKIKQQLVLGK